MESSGGTECTLQSLGTLSPMRLVRGAPPRPGRQKKGGVEEGGAGEKPLVDFTLSGASQSEISFPESRMSFSSR